ncbi:MAG: hemolysin family protein [Desulfobacterales bacterium]|nr:hemolysin family protein [Desulfobacterales bacterium]
MELLLLFFFVSIIFSFLCSIWEAVLLSIPPSYVAAGAKEGTRTGLILSRFKADIDRPLAAILTLNTIAHTVGAIGVGAQAAKLLSHATILGINVAAVIVPTVMTLAILILSEIIPKTLGAGHWRGLAGFTASSLQLIIFLLYPLVVLSQMITRLLKKEGEGSVLSRSEFSAMAAVIAEQGVLDKQESRIINSLLRFRAVRAEDVMTPRTVVVAADLNQSVGAFYADHKAVRLTRIPLYDGTIDRITGFAIRNDILSRMVEGQGDVLLRQLQRPILVVNEDQALPVIFNTLIEKRAHIAVVVDEYGGTAGILTMEDVVETLLGLEIVDEFDRTADMQQLARRNWEQRARKLGLIKEDQEAEDQKI